MTAPGVAAFVLLAFKVGVDDPRWFSRSRDVGAHFGSTPREYSPGEVSYRGRISKMGDREVRRLLYLAAARILRRDAVLWCPLKVWAVRLAQRVGHSKARVALARKLAVVLHAMWRDGQVLHCRPSPASAQPAPWAFFQFRRLRTGSGGKLFPQRRGGMGRERGCSLGARSSVRRPL